MKLRLLKYLMFCLVILSVDKVEGLSSLTMGTDSDIVSEIKNPETNMIKIAYSSFSMPENQCRIPRQSNFTSSVRTLVQAHRNGQHTGHSRQGFTLTKSGKSTNVSTTELFLSSIINFPSGMNEANHHLIGLRKLII